MKTENGKFERHQSYSRKHSLTVLLTSYPKTAVSGHLCRPVSLRQIKILWRDIQFHIGNMIN